MDQKFVLPGDEVAIAEMFSPGAGTYEENGVIYASNTGHVVFNERDRVVWVQPVTSVPQLPRRGDKILARVTDIRSNMVLLDMLRKEGSTRQLGCTKHATLHVSEITKKYTRSPTQLFGEDDIVRCQVIKHKPVVFVTTSADDLGIIHSDCGYCAVPLVMGEKGLECSECERSFKRYLANDYGRVHMPL